MVYKTGVQLCMKSYISQEFKWSPYCKDDPKTVTQNTMLTFKYLSAGFINQ